MCSSIPVGHPSIHLPSLAFPSQPVVNLLFRLASTMYHAERPTPTTAVLKLLTLQSTIQPNPRSAAFASNKIPSNFVNQFPQRSPLRIQLFSSNGVICITHAMINWTVASTRNPLLRHPRHTATSSPRHRDGVPAAHRTKGYRLGLEHGHCSSEYRPEEFEYCDSQSYLSFRHRSPHNDKGMSPPSTTICFRLTDG